MPLYKKMNEKDKKIILVDLKIIEKVRQRIRFFKIDKKLINLL